MVQLPGQAPVVVLDASELNLYEYRPVETIPVTGFVDDRGRVHFELNYVTYHLNRWKNFWKWLKNPRSFYYELPEHLINGSLLKEERRLIAGGQGVYEAKTGSLNLQNVGILHRRLIPDVDPTIRKQAIFSFQAACDRLIPWMGGRRAYSWTLIPRDKMEALGWVYQGYGPLGELVQFYWMSLPMSLVVFPKYFTKDYCPPK